MRVVTFEEAVSYIHDYDLIIIGGSGGGHAVPEALIVALESRFLKEAHPAQITLLHPVGLGDNVSQGVGHLAHPGLVKRIVTGALTALRFKNWPAKIELKPIPFHKVRFLN
jgi:propionate CoA-transferase